MYNPSFLSLFKFLNNGIIQCMFLRFSSLQGSDLYFKMCFSFHLESMECVTKLDATV